MALAEDSHMDHQLIHRGLQAKLLAVVVALELLLVSVVPLDPQTCKEILAAQV